MFLKTIKQNKLSSIGGQRQRQGDIFLQSQMGLETNVRALRERKAHASAKAPQVSGRHAGCCAVPKPGENEALALKRKVIQKRPYMWKSESSQADGYQPQLLSSHFSTTYTALVQLPACLVSGDRYCQISYLEPALLALLSWRMKALLERGPPQKCWNLRVGATPLTSWMGTAGRASLFFSLKCAHNSWELFLRSPPPHTE